MALGKRIRQLRQQHGWTQEELGRRVGVGQKQISAYERGVHLPSTEILLKLAEVFNITLDALAFEGYGAATSHSIRDRNLLERFEAVDDLPEKEKKLAIEILDMVILQHRFRQLLPPDGPT